MFLKVISFNLGTIRGRGRRHLVLIRYKEVASAPNPELSGRFIYAFNKEEWVSLCAQREGHLMCLTPHVPKASLKRRGRELRSPASSLSAFSASYRGARLLSGTHWEPHCTAQSQSRPCLFYSSSDAKAYAAKHRLMGIMAEVVCGNSIQANWHVIQHPLVPGR